MRGYTGSGNQPLTDHMASATRRCTAERCFSTPREVATVFDPDPASRADSTHLATPQVTAGLHTLQILTTEHWSLLAARSLVYTEAMSRTSIFVAALSGAVVALALVAQATDFGTGFVGFALVLLPVVYFLGWATVVRLSQVNLENARWVQGMNRIRNAYLQLAPELEPYFVTSRYDDDAGVLESTIAHVGPSPGTSRSSPRPGSSPLSTRSSRVPWPESLRWRSTLTSLGRSSRVACSSSHQSAPSSSGRGVGSAGSFRAHRLSFPLRRSAVTEALLAWDDAGGLRPGTPLPSGENSSGLPLAG